MGDLSTNDRKDRPFFIVGNPRSGTTLLRFILSSHSRIYIPEETGFLPHLTAFQGGSLCDDQIKELVTIVGDLNYEWHGLVDDVDAFVGDLSKRDLPGVLDALYRRKIRSHDAVRWGDKGPSYVRVIPALDQIFPNALYIHMVRDGRDCCVSSIRKWGEKHWYFDVVYLMKAWLANVRAGSESGKKLGADRYLEVRYEDLVTDTPGAVDRICEFLGERVESSMFEHTALAERLVGASGHDETTGRVSQRSIGNWRKTMTPFEQKVAVRIAGDTLQDFGYEQEGSAFTALESVRYTMLRFKFAISSGLRWGLYRFGVLKMSSAKRRSRS